MFIRKRIYMLVFKLPTAKGLQSAIGWIINQKVRWPAREGTETLEENSPFPAIRISHINLYAVFRHLNYDSVWPRGTPKERKEQEHYHSRRMLHLDSDTRDRRRQVQCGQWSGLCGHVYQET